MSKKQKIFILISIVFFIAVAILVWDMSRYTVKPWGRNKKGVHSKV